MCTCLGSIRLLRNIKFVKMAESMDGVCGPNNKRLKDYKQPSKEPEEVKTTRKLLEGINLRRSQREKEV